MVGRIGRFIGNDRFVPNETVVNRVAPDSVAVRLEKSFEYISRGLAGYRRQAMAVCMTKAAAGTAEHLS